MELVTQDDTQFAIRDTGRKVVILVDDDHETMVHAHHDTPGMVYAQGLYEVFLAVRGWPDIHAVGYFELPQERRDAGSLEEKLSAWIQQTGNAREQDLYFLIDVYYGHSSQENQRCDCVYTQLQRKYPNAKFALLSAAGTGEIDGHTALPLRAFGKFDIKRHYKETQELPGELRLWLQDLKELATAWTNKDWQIIRTYALELCCQISGDDKPTWAHHLKNGGLESTDPRYKALADVLKERLSVSWPLFAQSHLTDWNDVLDGSSLPWDLPPIRAMAQFDWFAPDRDGDIRTLVKLTANQLSHSCRNVEVICPRPSLVNDFLWLNATCLASGLALLSQGFSNKLSELGSRSKGSVSWTFTEKNTSKTHTALSVSIRQEILPPADCVAAATTTFPLPQYGEATGKVRGAYDLFERSGAELRYRNGQLEIDYRGLNKPIEREPLRRYPFWVNDAT